MLFQVGGLDVRPTYSPVAMPPTHPVAVFLTDFVQRTAQHSMGPAIRCVVCGVVWCAMVWCGTTYAPCPILLPSPSHILLSSILFFFILLHVLLLHVLLFCYIPSYVLYTLSIPLPVDGHSHDIPSIAPMLGAEEYIQDIAHIGGTRYGVVRVSLCHVFIVSCFCCVVSCFHCVV